MKANKKGRITLKERRRKREGGREGWKGERKKKEAREERKKGEGKEGRMEGEKKQGRKIEI